MGLESDALVGHNIAIDAVLGRPPDASDVSPSTTTEDPATPTNPTTQDDDPDTPTSAVPLKLGNPRFSSLHRRRSLKLARVTTPSEGGTNVMGRAASDPRPRPRPASLNTKVSLLPSPGLLAGEKTWSSSVCMQLNITPPSEPPSPIVWGFESGTGSPIGSPAVAVMASPDRRSIVARSAGPSVEAPPATPGAAGQKRGSFDSGCPPSPINFDCGFGAESSPGADSLFGFAALGDSEQWSSGHGRSSATVMC